MNRSDILAEVILNTRRSDRTSQINNAIDLALTEISQIHDFGSNKIQVDINLNAGDSVITLPAGCFQVLNVRLIDGSNSSVSNKVELSEKTKVITDYPNLAVDVQGWPVVCYVDTGTLVFVPPTSQQWTVRLEYFQLFAALAGDTTAIQHGLEMAVIAYVSSYVFRSTQQWDDHKIWQAEYGRCLGIAITADKRTRTERVLEPFGQHSEPITVPPYLDPFNKGE